MKKVEKFLNRISKLEPGCAPSVGYFTEIINEAREAKDEFDKAQQKRALVDMMRGDEELGLYDDNPKNHGY